MSGCLNPLSACRRRASSLFHLCKNHHFVDGNKRVAVAAAEIFLLLNNMCLIASDDELERVTVGVADGKVSKKEVTALFKKWIAKSGK
jgi:death-on-curing protein